ncbi:MAG: galactose mutarotase [Acidobacteriia bacterium]|nr:galactose mutarotase [Methyloceanibacter sp.]MBX5471650.1 galactose mutarotase [Acetobacteraceae bacterium]MCL6491216.1 galactose mutarotase [Terriglobia bacterium]
MIVALPQEAFGLTPDGRPIVRYTLRDGLSMIVRFLNLGGVITEIQVPDREGRPTNVVLGFARGELYQQGGEAAYFGALIGRYANRIGGAQFSLGGRIYRLDANDGRNTLHGGKAGFHTCLWNVRASGTGPEPQSAVLSLQCPDGEGGFPGTLALKVRYSLAENALAIDYRITTDRETFVNPTSHCYFNLAGAGSGSVDEHLLEIFASRYTPINAELLPTGEIASVADTPLDFRRPTAIGARIREAFPQLLHARGYDHNYVLDKLDTNPHQNGRDLHLAARVYEPKSGRILEVLTTEPGLQFYSGNGLNGSLVGAEGRAYRQSDGFCLETQHFPDSPNNPQFPATLLRPGEIFSSRTVYRFLTDTDKAAGGGGFWQP